MTPEMIAAVDGLVRETHCITISEIAVQMKIGILLTSSLQRSCTTEKSVQCGLLLF